MDLETSEQAHLEELLNGAVREHLRVAASARLSRGSYSWSTSDLVQEALLRILQGQRRDWGSKEHFYGYLVLTVHSAYVDYLRERNSLARGEGDRGVSIEHLFNLSNEPGAPTYAMSVLDLDDILAEVPAETARIILLRTYLSWTQAQIAEELKVPLSRVRAACAWYEAEVRKALDLDLSGQE